MRLGAIGVRARLAITRMRKRYRRCCRWRRPSRIFGASPARPSDAAT